MKRYIIIVCILITNIGMTYASDKSNLSSDKLEITSRSYLNTVQPFQSMSPELITGFRSDRTNAREDGWHGAIQAVVLGGRSTKSEHTTRYFFPFGKTVLHVEEDLKQVAEINKLDPVDLYTAHFGVETVLETFQSRIAIAPKQTVVGGGLQWRQSLWRKNDRGVWVSISMPIVHIKNQLNFKETIINNGDGLYTSSEYTAQAATMTDAFKQTAWNYGKIDDSADDMKKTGVADVEIKLGYEWLDTEPYHFESYIGVHVPTGNRPKAAYLFEAVVGSGKHVGIMFGNSFGCELYANDAHDKCVRMEVALGSKYLFKKDQTRSFDLNNKPWSRYIQLYKSIDDATAAATLAATNAVAARNNFTPGINILTQEVEVTPGFMHNLNAGWVMQVKWFQAEIGYNLLSRQSECIEMEEFTYQPAIKHLFGIGETNPIRDMTGNFLLETSEGSITGNLPVPLSLYSQSVLTVSDINLSSAATPAHLAHTVYGSVGANFDECRWPILTHLGASYTFSRATNAIMDHWTVWAKLGISI